MIEFEKNEEIEEIECEKIILDLDFVYDNIYDELVDMIYFYKQTSYDLGYIDMFRNLNVDSLLKVLTEYNIKRKAKFIDDKDLVDYLNFLSDKTKEFCESKNKYWNAQILKKNVDIYDILSLVSKNL